MARTFQNIRLFHNMTSVENVLVAMHSHIKGGVLGLDPRHAAHQAARRSRRSEGARELLAFVGLGAARRRVREEPALRRPAPARGGARARDRAEAAAARRADRRDEPGGDRPVHRVRRAAARRARPDRAADRARHEASSWASPTASPCSTTARRSPRARPARCSSDPRVIEAYLGTGGDRVAPRERERNPALGSTTSTRTTGRSTRSRASRSRCARARS